MNTFRGIVMGLVLGYGAIFLLASFDSNISVSAVYLSTIILGSAGWIVDTITKTVAEKGEDNTGWIIDVITKTIAENEKDKN